LSRSVSLALDSATTEPFVSQVVIMGFKLAAVSVSSCGYCGGNGVGAL